MRKEQIINELKELQTSIKVDLYNSVLYGTRMRMVDKIDNVINLIEETDFEDTPDIMDGGINDVDYELMSEE